MDFVNGFRGLPFSLLIFILLMIVAALKVAIYGTMAALIIVVGNSAVTVGLWPAHAFWTYYSLARTKKIGPILKTIILVSLVVPIILVPVTVILGSILVGLAYGLVAPLMATFEADGEGHEDKCMHCIVDGTLTTVKGSCTVVRDFTDVCFHSYFSLMDELHDQPPKDGKALDIKLRIGCPLGSSFGCANYYINCNMEGSLHDFERMVPASSRLNRKRRTVL